MIKLFLLTILFCFNLVLQRDLLFQFKDLDKILQYPKRYYHLLIEKDKEVDFEEICTILEDYNLKQLNLKAYYYLTKIIHKLKCDLDHTQILQESEKNINSDNLLFFYYSFFIQHHLNPDFKYTKHCKYINTFQSNEQGVYSSRKDSNDQNYYLTSIVLEILEVCGSKSSSFKKQMEKILKNSLTGLVPITKDTLGWLNKQFTFFTTLRMLKFYLKQKIHLITSTQFKQILKYIHKHKPFQMNYQEQTEFNYFQELLKEKQIYIIENQNILYLYKCQAKCKIKLNQYLPDYNAEFDINNKKVTIDVNKKGEILIERNLIEKVETLKMELKSKNYLFIVNQEIKIVHLNKINMIRAKISSHKETFDLIDSDNNNCENLYLPANQHNFLHFGISPQIDNKFLFVYLKSLDNFSSSKMVSAQYNLENNLYVSVFDLGDYYTILPNSGKYQIIIVMGSDQNSLQEKSCGVIEMNFNNKEVYERQKLDASLETVLKKFDNKIIDNKINPFLIGYMLIISIILFVLYNILLQQYFPQLNKINFSLKIIKYGFWIVFGVIVYLSYKTELFEKFWIVLVLLVLYSYLFGKLIQFLIQINQLNQLQLYYK